MEVGALEHDGDAVLGKPPGIAAAHVVDGTAARVLDYSALWVHPDGSSYMLEHEILRIQAQEEIGKESEQAPPTGIILHLRVLKPDGSELEPEPVEGKPTLTMPPGSGASAFSTTRRLPERL